MAEIIAFPRKTLEQRMDEIVANFDRETDRKFVPDAATTDRLMKQYFEALIALGKV